jgi:tripartite-type tricarboxylate transporter receptor subunit TctC
VDFCDVKEWIDDFSGGSMSNRRLRAALIVILAGNLFSLAPRSSFAAASYFEGKTITMLRGGTPGGSGDNQVRALIPYLRKNIAGTPTIIIQHMPGAAGMKALNHTYASAKPDGLTIATVGAGLAAGAVLSLPGAQYDIDKLMYLGSTEHGDPYAFHSRKESGLDSLEKLRAASGIRIGAQTIGHPIYISGRIFAYVLGLKDPKFVVGFSGPELDVALARGEIDARSNGADTLLVRQRDAFEKGEFALHATIIIPQGKVPPRFAGIPELDGFVRNDRERQLIRLFRAFLYPRWPYVLPPNTPPDIVSSLREAMAKAFKDPGFHKDFNKLMGTDPSPLTGAEVASALRGLPRDPEILGLYKKMAEDGPLPPR